MKKSLLALAVSAAVAVPAFAQNVTVYGVLDQAVGSKETTSAGGSITSGFGGILTTNAIGFRGTEDLGGGLKAEFQYEAEPNMFTQRDGATATQTLGQTGASFLRLSGNFGALTLGRFGALARNAGGTGSFIGNIGLAGNVGSIDTDFNGTAGTRISIRTLGDFTDNAVAYTSPNISGFTAQVYQSFSNNGNGFTGAPAAAATVLGDQTAIGATYAQGPLAIGVGHLTREITATSKAVQIALGANYDFGVARLGIAYNKFTEDDSAAAATHKATVVQGSVPLDGGLALIGSYHFYKQDANATLNKAKAFSVGLTKSLSKRTTAYVAHATAKNENNARYSLGANDMVAATTAGFDPSATWVGIRHSF